MKYRDLIEFCRIVIATNADEDMLSKLHVKSDGVIAITMIKIIDAIINEEDFDVRNFVDELINYVDNDKKSKLLN